MPQTETGAHLRLGLQAFHR